MAEREAFLIRVDPTTLNAVRRWADDELRSVNAQIEFILRRALREAGRLRDEGGNQSGSSRTPGARPP